MTDGIVAVNIMFAVKQFMKRSRRRIEAGVDMIVTGAGSPATSQGWGRITTSHRLHRLLPEFGKLASEAARTRSSWRRKEAGGHLGTDRPLRGTVPRGRKVVKKVPLIAAAGSPTATISRR